MRSIEQIIADNGFDNAPALDTHNLTGRADEWPLSYEHWLGVRDVDEADEDAWYEAQIGWPDESGEFDHLLDCE